MSKYDMNQMFARTLIYHQLFYSLLYIKLLVCVFFFFTNYSSLTETKANSFFNWFFQPFSRPYQYSTMGPIDLFMDHNISSPRKSLNSRLTWNNTGTILVHFHFHLPSLTTSAIFVDLLHWRSHEIMISRILHNFLLWKYTLRDFTQSSSKAKAWTTSIFGPSTMFFEIPQWKVHSATKGKCHLTPGNERQSPVLTKLLLHLTASLHEFSFTHMSWSLQNVLVVWKTHLPSTTKWFYHCYSTFRERS